MAIKTQFNCDNGIKKAFIHPSIVLQKNFGCTSTLSDTNATIHVILKLSLLTLQLHKLKVFRFMKMEG